MDPAVDDAWTQFLPGQRLDDQSCIARFFLKPCLLGLKSQQAGREIYEDREFIEIMVKGQPQQIVHEKVTPEHIQRFPNAYAAFKQGKEAPVIGTPVDKLGVGPSTIINYKAIGIRTIEDVANASDEVLGKMGAGARALQEKAKQMLAQNNPAVESLKSENEQLKERLAALEAMMKPKRKYTRRAA